MPAEGEVERAQHLETDLRDVVVSGDALYVTQFRSAKVFEVRGESVRAIGAPAPFEQPDRMTRLPAVAWRATAIGDDVVMLHESAVGVIAPVHTSSGGAYGSALSPSSVARVPMITRVTTLTAGASPTWSDGVAMLDAGLAVDVAARTDAQGRREIAVASPGWAYGQRVPQVRVAWIDERGLSGRASVRTPTGQAVAVAWTRSGALVVQTRASGSLLIADDPRVDVVRGITLYDEHDASTRDFAGDLGHDVFHATTPAGIACASCHPEGGDDGRVWTFADIGRRRTPSLRGGVMKTAPFHWDGDLVDVAALAHEVFTRRMGGPTLTAVEFGSLGRWLDTIPLVPASPPSNPAAVTRGEALFRSPSVGCDACHNGAGYTNNASVGVGTGGNFQTPSLTGLWLRAPYMHDGRATTLADRFNDLSCGGDAHGSTAHLSQQQRADLVAFLETL